MDAMSVRLAELTAENAVLGTDAKESANALLDLVSKFNDLFGDMERLDAKLQSVTAENEILRRERDRQIERTEARTAALTAECDGLKSAQLVPGEMYCAKCKFGLIRTNLYLGRGTTGPGDNETEPCPNGCGPLWPVTWEKSARDSWKTCEEIFEREQAEKARVVKLREAIEQCAHSMEVARLWDGMKWHWNSLHSIPVVDVWSRLRVALANSVE